MVQYGDDRPQTETDDLGRDPRVRAATEWEEVTRRYHRPPGGWWWLALLAVPALLAALGLGIGAGDSNASDAEGSPTMSASVPATGSATADASTGSSASTSTSQASTPAPEGAAPSPFTIAKSGQTVKVTAQVPDEAAKTTLIDSVKAAAPGATIEDAVTVKAGSVAPTAAALSPVLAAATKAGDYSVAWDGQTATLKGVAPSQAEKDAVASSVTTAWPNAKVDNHITVGAGGTDGTAEAASCSTLGTDITKTLSTNKLVFANNGTLLTSASVTVVKGIAAKVKACPDAKLTVTGHTDNTGTDAINGPLSTRRAESVRTVLVQAGVPAASVTAQGKGSKEPKTTNDTAAGRADNRRVEISVN